MIVNYEALLAGDTAVREALGVAYEGEFSGIELFEGLAQSPRHSSAANVLQALTELESTMASLFPAGLVALLPVDETQAREVGRQDAKRYSSEAWVDMCASIARDAERALQEMRVLHDRAPQELADLTARLVEHEELVIDFLLRGAQGEIPSASAVAEFVSAHRGSATTSAAVSKTVGR